MTSKTILKRQQNEKQLIIENLKQMPIIQIACNKSGVGRATYYRWKSQDLQFAQDAEKAQEEGINLINDLAESKIISGINDGNLTASMYWLNHRHNAYRNKVEVTTDHNQPQEALTLEQQEAVKKAMVLTGLAEKQPAEKS